MGTNYYLKRNVCPHCGRGAGETLHIGKSSAGWCFSLRVHDDEHITGLSEWVDLWSQPTNAIENEYGEHISPEKMLSIITQRGREGWPQIKEAQLKPYGYDSWPAFHQDNDSEEGPSGLLRHRLGPFCCGHGAGTWDLIPREFS